MRKCESCASTSVNKHIPGHEEARKHKAASFDELTASERRLKTVPWDELGPYLSSEILQKQVASSKG